MWGNCIAQTDKRRQRKRRVGNSTKTRNKLNKVKRVSFAHYAIGLRLNAEKCQSHINPLVFFLFPSVYRILFRVVGSILPNERNIYQHNQQLRLGSLITQELWKTNSGLTSDWVGLDRRKKIALNIWLFTALTGLSVMVMVTPSYSSAYFILQAHSNLSKISLSPGCYLDQITMT